MSSCSTSWSRTLQDTSVRPFEWPSCRGRCASHRRFSLYDQMKACNESCACCLLHAHIGCCMRLFDCPFCRGNTNAFLRTAKSTLAMEAAHSFCPTTEILCMLKHVAHIRPFEWPSCWGSCASHQCFPLYDQIEACNDSCACLLHICISLVHA